MCANSVSDWTLSNDCNLNCPGDDCQNCGGFSNLTYHLYSVYSVPLSHTTTFTSNSISESSVVSSGTTSWTLTDVLSTYYFTSVNKWSSKVSTNSMTNPTTQIPIDLSQPFTLNNLLTALGGSSTVNVSQVLDILVNKTFSFDLSASGSLPTGFLTSSTLDISNCMTNCTNVGSCKLTPDMKFLCLCDPDFSGSSCQTDQRPCSNEPCLHFKQCKDIYNGTSINPANGAIMNVYSGFECICQDYYYGQRCEKKVNLCENETCSGNGICQVNHENNTISCKCFGINSFSGDHCEIKSASKVAHEATVKLASIVAIISVILFYAFVIFLDYHKYYIMKQPFIPDKVFKRMTQGKGKSITKTPAKPQPPKSKAKPQPPKPNAKQPTKPQIKQPANKTFKIEQPNIINDQPMTSQQSIQHQNQYNNPDINIQLNSSLFVILEE